MGRTLKYLNFLALVFLFLGCRGTVTVHPNIIDINDGDSAEFTHGQDYEITGAGFGAKSPVEPLSFDDFEGGSIGTKLGSAKIGRGWSHQAIVSGDDCCWGSICQPCTFYSGERTHAGLKSAEVTVDTYGYNFFGWTSSDNFKEIYIRYWRYFDPFYDDLHNICNHKQIYIYNSVNDSPQWLLGAVQRVGDPWPIAPQGSCINTFLSQYGDYRPLTLGYSEIPYDENDVKVWKRWELYMRNDSPASAHNGAEYLWLDGKLLTGTIRYSNNTQVTDREHMNLLTDDCSTQNIYMQDVRIGAMVHNDDPCGDRDAVSAPDITFLDDAYIDSTRARIEICDSATWSAKESNGAICEIQIPKETWNDTTIKFTANKGSFTAGEQLYLYVINSEGSVNEDGIEVKFN